MARGFISGLLDLDAERLLSDFIRSNIGLSVMDRRLRYQAVNPFLAATNGTSVEAHLGKHLREILGDIAPQVEPAIERVFATAQPVLNCEVAGVLPTRTTAGHWLGNLFPIVDSTGNVTQVGTVVIELPLDTIVQAPHSKARNVGTVLRSWKDIAHYVGACVKTVQRWEAAYQFPIRRLNPNKGSVVFALKEDVDRWFQSLALESGTSRSDRRVLTSLHSTDQHHIVECSTCGAETLAKPHRRKLKSGSTDIRHVFNSHSGT